MDKSIDAEKILIISGPSGVGKSTIVQKLLEKAPVPLELSISATTREPRNGEKDGVDYVFLADDEFQAKKRNGEFFECKEVFGRGYWYGTLKETVQVALEAGKWILLEIDVEGARAVKEELSSVNMIFIHPGSMETLEQRLRDRNTDSEDSILRRLEVARQEIEQASWYDHVIENREVEQTVDRICQILEDLKKSID